MSVILVALVALAVGAALAYLVNRRDLRSLYEEVERLRAERVTLVSQILDAEERERSRVAQALHDDALQSLLAAHQDLLEAAPGRAQVTRAHDVVGVAIDRVRDAVTALHPVILEQRGLEPALEAVCTQAEGSAGLHSELRVDPDAVGASDGLVFSVARELVSNAVRHAKASHLAVTVEAMEGWIVLEVSDDGQGIPAGRRDEALDEGHVGLASIEQRVGAIGGTLELKSSSADGTRAIARIPR